LLDGSDPALLALISDRVAVIHDLLFEDRSEERDDLIDDINAALDVEYGFDNLIDAADALLGQFLESDEEEIPEHTDEAVLAMVEGAANFESLSELDKEILLGEAAEEGKDEAEEYITDLAEEISE